MNRYSYDPIQQLLNLGFDIHFQSHAKSILYGEFAPQLKELSDSLIDISLPISEIIGGGGGEAKFTQRLRRSLASKSWRKLNFRIDKTINGIPSESISHEVDHVREVYGVGTLACEIEWNNKDPFFDRDLENFKRLHAEGAISAGIIITRGESLQNDLEEAVLRYAHDNNIQSFEDLERLGYPPTTQRKRRTVTEKVSRSRNPYSFAEAWANNFTKDKYGAATTHWIKLRDRIQRGVGNPCPLLFIGIPSSIIVFDHKPIDPLDDEMEEDGILLSDLLKRDDRLY
ncbi:BglII/BstYI family type II restriction endonuclease [Metapseudomonas otitidis]|uniref:BglII/BstYI family type II restriction endonuclease n=1 Tax=Metapseudomonas otitidis TaxID=319939 RepID=UPI0013F67C8B|nr:BglII/BstYI family type II restriction endonuclease [Pseudomonas otitidis]